MDTSFYPKKVTIREDSLNYELLTADCINCKINNEMRLSDIYTCISDNEIIPKAEFHHRLTIKNWKYVNFKTEDYVLDIVNNVEFSNDAYFTSTMKIIGINAKCDIPCRMEKTLHDKFDEFTKFYLSGSAIYEMYKTVNNIDILSDINRDEKLTMPSANYENKEFSQKLYEYIKKYIDRKAYEDEGTPNRTMPNYQSPDVCSRYLMDIIFEILLVGTIHCTPYLAPFEKSMTKSYTLSDQRIADAFKQHNIVI